MTIQSIGIIVVFVVFLALLMTKKLPTMIGMPLLAVAIALVAGMPVVQGEENILSTVLSGGAMRLSGTMAGLLFGAFFGQIINKVGITKDIIRRASELAGDKPLVICLVFLAVSSICFSAAGGLGMVILVGTIILPIMLTAGVDPLVAAMVLLLGNGIGSVFNVQNWGIYKDVLGCDVETIASYSWVIGVPLIVASVIMVLVYFKKGKTVRKAWAMPAAEDASEGTKKVPVIALITPLVPILLVFIAKFDIVPAITCGIIAALVLTWTKHPLNVLSAAIIEGFQSVAGAFVLMMGIGMLLASVSSSYVATVMSPLISAIVPGSAVTFILFFTLLSPLAIYRGPLNVYGLGSGVAALLIGAGMSPVAAMIGLRACTNMQSVCDPTNTHNVWTTEFCQTDLNGFTKKSILYVAASILVSVAIGAAMIF